MIELVRWEEFGRYDPKDHAFFNHCQLIPLVHQIIGNPSATHRFPAVPRGEEEFWGAIQYWDAAYYYLTVVLGWADPGVGLLWYYNNDRRDFGDYRLQVLKQVWDGEGQLDRLAAWLFRQRYGQLGDAQLLPVFVGGNVPEPMRLVPGEWWTQFNRKYADGQPPYGCPYGPNPFGDDVNPLHLGHFDFVFEQNAAPALLVQSESSKRTACLVLDNCSGWYGNLVRLGRTLPPLGDRSWHVEVFAKTIGYLGTFRQSRETGLWFHGKHDTHSAGNSHKVA